MKGKHKALLFVVILVAGVLCGIVMSLRFSGRVNQALGDGRMSRAEKFMDQMKYEQAVIAFQSAIRIDPKRADAYLGLAEAYQELGQQDTAVQVLALGVEATQSRDVSEEFRNLAMQMYEECLEKGDYEGARTILELILEVTGDKEADRKLEELEEQEKLGAENLGILKRLYEACRKKDAAYIAEFMKTEDYRKLLSLVNEPLVYPSGSDWVIVIYNNKALYYGDWKDGKRQGEGNWLKADQESTNLYTGSWSDDAPEGSGTVTFSKYTAGGRLIYTARTTGTFSRGKENGDMTLVHEQDYEINTFHYKADHGKAIPLNNRLIERNESQYVVAVSEEHSDKKFVTTDTEEYGVYGFISAGDKSAGLQ